MPVARLDRAVLRLSGDNLLPWLEGLLTNSLGADMTFTALLTPQGKIIADFFVTKVDNAVLIDTPKKFGPDLLKRLKMYKLREKIDIEDISETHVVYAAWNMDEPYGHPDPRTPALGYRHISESLDALEDAAAYDAHRLSLGIPDSQWDFETASVFPADAYMDMLSGVDFQKGCFVGQEVVSRMKRMTTVKKRMRGLVLEETAQAGDNILSGERVVGEVLHVRGKSGMGLIRLNRLKDAALSLTINGSSVAVMHAPDGSNT